MRYYFETNAAFEKLYHITVIHILFSCFRHNSDDPLVRMINSYNWGANLLYSTLCTTLSIYSTLNILCHFHIHCGMLLNLQSPRLFVVEYVLDLTKACIIRDNEGILPFSPIYIYALSGLLSSTIKMHRLSSELGCYSPRTYLVENWFTIHLFYVWNKTYLPLRKYL